eukprot:CAMPEP_0203882768 /NCGR_PEP_ID=MMETSP0359-20131031/26933_1 /ASSEMBLY_ACC=CAM_ASM_000338 /TAXON_ID=268821 /ORGANISM="Scrippsiella Hangoei, Strain SHTV-5" /LENGTH=176 /DNA_ID=CAMNT_0050802861 /DNA_START=6 /DNA_END=532 /DNA_ORIENTATION=-
MAAVAEGAEAASSKRAREASGMEVTRFEIDPVGECALEAPLRVRAILRVATAPDLDGEVSAAAAAPMWRLRFVADVAYARQATALAEAPCAPSSLAPGEHAVELLVPEGVPEAALPRGAEESLAVLELTLEVAVGPTAAERHELAAARLVVDVRRGRDGRLQRGGAGPLEMTAGGA